MRPGRPWKRIIGSFCLMLGIYGFYSVAIVPFIEPAAPVRPDFDEMPQNLDAGFNVVEMQRDSLKPWFAPGDWELRSAKVFESPRAKLVLNKYERRPDGRLSITPCTIVFLSTAEAATEEERNRKAVILKAPELILSFDAPVDLTQFKLEKLTGGELRGPVTIHSDQNLPGSEDDLVITTRDAELIGDRIVTPNLVDFRLGRNTGIGRDLEIVLAPASAPKPNSPAPNFSGINSLTLKRDVHMRLHPGQADMFGGAALRKPAGAANQAGANATERPRENPPVDITCAGAFQFDMLRHAAVFHKHVDVLAVNLEAANDHLSCEVLSIFFEPVLGGATGANPQPAATRQTFPKLEPSRIEADGNPVVILSPSRGIQARGTRLEYDLKKNAGSLRGPGWLERSGDARGRTVEARWETLLEFGPLEGGQRAKLVGDAHVQSVGVGELSAGTILLFLVEQAAPDSGPQNRNRLVPDRLQAFQRVHFNSPTLSGDVEHLQVWIAQSPAGMVAAPAAPAAGGSPQQSAGPMAPGAAVDPASAAPRQHVHVAGKLLQVEAVMAEKSSDVRRIHIEVDTEDNIPDLVELRETQTAEPGVRPLVIKGDQIDVEQPLPNQSIVHILGRPAHVEAREMSLDGAAIHLDRGRNFAWVDGQGLMTYFVPTDLAGQPLAQPQPLEITWKGHMEFNGREATFFDGVKALMQQQRINPTGAPVAEHQKLTADWLCAVFNPRIVFAEVRPGARPQIAEVLCRGNVFLERTTFEARRQTALERMQSVDLSVEPATGKLEGHGPGWVRRVWIDTGEGLPGVPRAVPVAAKPQAKPAGDQLAYLGIDFQGTLTGNQQRNNVDFDDRVRCVYSHVPDWDTVIEADDPDKLGEGGALMTSDHLQVERVPAVSAGDPPSFMMEATGNVKLDGKAGTSKPRDSAGHAGSAAASSANYSATGSKMRYVDTKKMFVIEGDGNNPATISRQTRVGAPRDIQVTRKMMYYPLTNHIDFEDAYQTNIEGLGPAGPRKPAPTAPPATRPGK